MLTFLASLTGCVAPPLVQHITQAVTRKSLVGSGQFAVCTGGTRVADAGGPHGVFVVLFPGAQAGTPPDVLQYIVPDPTNCGATIIIPWSAIDHGPAASPRYDWTYVDHVAAPWRAAHKVVNLVFEGIGEGHGGEQATPQYVLDTAKTISCPTADAPSINPVYWDPGYQQPFRAYEAAVVAHFASAAWLGYLRFGIGAGGEDYPTKTIHESAGCRQEWQAAGLSPAQWQGFSLAQLEYQASLHSVHPLLASTNQLIGGDNTLADAVGAEAVRLGIGIGNQGLAQGLVTAYDAGKPCYADWCALYNTDAGRVPLEVQTFAASDPTGAGKTGALPPLLTFALARHAQIFELYPEEWLVADDPPWTGYAPFHAQYQAALAALAAAVGGGKG